LSHSPSSLASATLETVATEELAEAETQVIIAPPQFAKAHEEADALTRAERRRGLADDIRQRILKRLADRVHDLVVRLDGDTVVLEGRCATYYTKQLAQCFALGALEDEQLENAIVVTM
jgi:hypothetical protein